MKNRLPTELPQSLKNVHVKSILRRIGIYTKQSQYLELKQAAIPIAIKLLKQTKGQHPKKSSHEATRRHAQFTDEIVDEYWQKQIHIVEVVEKHFENKIEQFIKHVEKGFLDQLDTEVSNRKSFVEFIKKDYFDENEDDLLIKAQIDFAPLLDNIAVLAGQEANKLIGVESPYLPINLRKQIIENVNKFTKSMLDTDRDALVDIISNGLQDGKSVPEIRTSIQEIFDNYSKMQAQRITRTEVIRASNQAALDAYDQSGIVEGKQWLTAGAIDECAQYEGQIKTLDGSFYDSDSEFEDGDPPLHPNCRCVLLPVVVGTKAYRPEPIYEKEILHQRIEDLEKQIDKRTKEFKKLKAQSTDDRAYIKALEQYVGADESTENSNN